MKKLIAHIMILMSLSGLAGSKSGEDPSNWTNKKIDRWFAGKAWAAGWTVSPDVSINKREFAVSYYKNKARWEKAFRFLTDNNLLELEPKRHDIDGDNLFAIISEYMSKNEGESDFEAHRKYIDIQYVVSGNEIISVSPLTNVKQVLTQYDETKDIEFIMVSRAVNYKATPSNFFILFPGDAHRPGLRDGVKSPVRKVVVKVKVD